MSEQQTEEHVRDIGDEAFAYFRTYREEIMGRAVDAACQGTKVYLACVELSKEHLLAEFIARASGYDVQTILNKELNADDRRGAEDECERLLLRIAIAQGRLVIGEHPFGTQQHELVAAQERAGCSMLIVAYS